jgi:hypothetical protein
LGARAADYFQFLIFADDKIRESLVNLYHYPGIRHPGTLPMLGEYFLRWLDHFKGPGTAGLPAILLPWFPDASLGKRYAPGN